MGSSPNRADARVATIAQLEQQLGNLPAGRDDVTDARRAALLLKLGIEQSTLARDQDALQSFGEAESLLRGASEGQQRAALVRLQRARLLNRNGAHEEALQLTTAMSESSTDPELVPSVYRVRFRALRSLGQWSQAFAEANTFINRYQPATATQRQRETAAVAYEIVSRSARELGRIELALPAINSAIAITNTLPTGRQHPKLRALLLSVMLDRAVVLESLREPVDAQLAYETVINEFKNDPDTLAQTAVEQARSRLTELQSSSRRG